MARHNSLINQKVLKNLIDIESNKKKQQALKDLLNKFPSAGNPYSSDEIQRIIRLEMRKYV